MSITNDAPEAAHASTEVGSEYDGNVIEGSAIAILVCALLIAFAVLVGVHLISRMT